MAGRGATINISRSVIVFKADSPLPAGHEIEMYVDWPARLVNVIPIRLHVHGETIEDQSGYAAVKILRHEVRIARRPNLEAVVLLQIGEVPPRAGR